MKMKKRHTMNLIDRYVYEVGRHLPARIRSDRRAELRSSLMDTLRSRAGDAPSEDDINAVLEKKGPPRAVAASLYPDDQYLIAPALYPLFQMVAGITLVAVAGAQLLAWGVAMFVAQDPVGPLEALASLSTILPAALGMVVIVFAILQRLDVRPSLEDAACDARSLSHSDEFEGVGRGGRLFGLGAGIAILVLLSFFPEYIGFVTTPGGEFFSNPVIQAYLPWISLSLLANIGLDIYLLWKGRWSTGSRIAKIATNMFGVMILTLLLKGHSAWLAERRAGGLIDTLERPPSNTPTSWQIVGMQAFRLAFAGALVVTIGDTLIMAYRMVRASLDGGYTIEGLPARQA